MGEIDTKPIESVQTVISFFGRNEQKKNSPIKDDEEEQEVKKERELANIKVEMEAKDKAYKQALVMIDHHQKTADDLSVLLNKSDLQKDFYISESREAKARVNELEKAQQQLTNELESAHGQLMHMETQLKALEKLATQIDKEKSELKEQEKEAQVEIAMLKSELHKGRAKVAAAEAAETRAQSQKSALYNALQQMGLEAEEMNKEKRLLKETTHDQDMEKVKRELEVAMSKMGELRTRAEQAVSRAEAAEKATGVLEEQIRKRKDHKLRRRAALAALRQESISTSHDNDNTNAKNYQPLGKVLDMEF